VTSIPAILTTHWSSSLSAALANVLIAATVAFAAIEAAAAGALAVHGVDLSDQNTPRSLANCSKVTGRKDPENHVSSANCNPVPTIQTLSCIFRMPDPTTTTNLTYQLHTLQTLQLPSHKHRSLSIHDRLLVTDLVLRKAGVPLKLFAFHRRPCFFQKNIRYKREVSSACSDL
jgi:hypothetical protein